MQARFLLGPAGSGKTFRCLAEIRAALVARASRPFDGKAKHAGETPAPLVLLAPKQATFQLERQLLAGDEICGYTRLQIFSFDRLARFVLENFSIAPPKLLSEEGRVMVLRALLMRHENELELFGRSARRPGFALELSALLTELQQHQFTPARLRALGGRADLRRELRGKLHDLALLHEKYSRWLEANELRDANQLLNTATEALRKHFSLQPSAFSLSALWLDGFAEMTPQEMDLLAAVLPFCDRATLAFCLDESGTNESGKSWLSIWNAVGRTYSQCRRRIENLPNVKIETELLPRYTATSRFANNPALRRLEEDWLRPAGGAFETSNPKAQISIAACAHPEAEAVFAAREILKSVRAGIRFRDCAVLVRDLENYHQPLARTFRRYEIPFFLDRRESVAHHPLAGLVRGTLRTVAGDWRHDDWFATLKSGFSVQQGRGRPAREKPEFAGEPPALLTEADMDRLENAALESGWRGQKWRGPLPDEYCERARQRIFPPFANFAAQLQRFKFRPDGAQLAGTLRGLWDELGVEEILERWTRAEEKSATGDRQPAMHQTVFEQMNLWLENLAQAFPHEPLPLRDWLPVVEAGLASLTVGVIPPALDEVLIGAIDRARNPDLKFALVLGLNEGVFPATPAPAAILTDADRDELGRTIRLGPDLREQLASERYYGYIACTRASEKVAVTFSRSDAGGKALNPSSFVTHLQRIFPALKVEEFQAEIEPAEAEHASELAPLLAYSSERRAPARRISGGVQALACSPSTLKRELQRAGPETGAPPAWASLLEIPVLKSLAEDLAQLHEPDTEEELSPALAEKLYGPALQTSVSRLEEFAQCPFKFFVRSGLRAGERKLFELDARERGSFQHEVLKIFHEQVTADGKRWRDLTPVEARDRVAKIAAGLEENFHDGLMRDTARTRFEARAMTESLQDFIVVIVSWMHGQYEFDPAAAELDFGGESSSVPAWELDLGNGRRLALRGRVDRVDLCRDGDRALAVVMDYKSRGQELDAVLVEHGVQLQLLAYLNVVRNWKNPGIAPGVARLFPAGVFYVNLRGEYRRGGTRDEILADADESRRKAYRHTGRFDAGILDKLDRLKRKDQFSYQLKKDGSLYANSVEAMPRVEFEALLDGVETRLREMGRAIFSGEAKVDPYRKGAATPCEFCDYRAVCRIDPWTHMYRVLRSAPKENPA